MKIHIRRWILITSACPAFIAALAQQPGMQLPKPQMPDETTPNTKPPHHQRLSTKDVGEKLRKGLDNKKPAYAGSNIQATVDDQSIALTGTVTSEQQHEMALQLAQAYGDDRKIIDRLTIQ